MWRRLMVMGLMALCAVLVVRDAEAKLAWESRQVEAVAKLGQEQVRMTFAFENVGEEAVTITDIRPSCGCTTADLEKKTYEPGEKGCITAIFDIGNRSGMQSKQIVVRTDSQESPVVTLTLKVDVPELVRIQPNFVYWRKGEPRTSKTITIEVVSDEPVVVAAAKSNNDDLNVSLKTVKEGERYDVEVTPTDAAAAAKVLIEVKLPDGKVKTVTANARVFAPAETASADHDETKS